MTKHFDIPREKIREAEIEFIYTEILKDGETNWRNEVKVFFAMLFAAVSLAFLISLV